MTVGASHFVPDVAEVEFAAVEGAAIAGGGLLTVAEVRQRRLAGADTYDAFATDYDSVTASSRNLRIAGAVGLSVGAALVAGAVVRWMVVRRRPAAERTAWLVPTGTGVALGGRF